MRALDMCATVVSCLFVNSEIRKEADDSVGGHVLDLEAIRIHNEGREQGREEGREEGRDEVRQKTARNLLAMKLPVAQIASAVGMTEEEVLALTGS